MNSAVQRIQESSDEMDGFFRFFRFPGVFNSFIDQGVGASVAGVCPALRRCEQRAGGVGAESGDWHCSGGCCEHRVVNESVASTLIFQHRHCKKDYWTMTREERC